MERLLIQPSGPLSGSVAIDGAKNSALKLMAATLLAEGQHVLRNVPDITDVTCMADVLRSMGLGVERRGDEVVIDRPEAGQIVPEAPWELVERMRASTAVLGPLLARFGRARVALPGGDDFGPRPVDLHVRSLEQLGAVVELRHGYIEATADRLVGARIDLAFPSVGATENALMAAVLAKGTTVIDNAAREPEIADLARFLNRMGATVLGAGGPTIRVEGTDELSPTDHTVIPDRIEAATYLAALAIAGGEITLHGAHLPHLTMVVEKFGEMGMRVAADPDGIWAAAPRRPIAADVSTLPYPGLATDVKPLLVAVLSVAEGTGIVSENLFSGRFRYVDELVRMGADIRVDGHHAVVRGREWLSGAPVRAHDIRAGAALAIAGLRAEGETLVTDAGHIARGYPDFVDKLSGIGARIEEA